MNPAILLALVVSSLVYQAPPNWVRRESSSPMRLDQWSYRERSEIVVFYFGPGQGGSVEANLDRWYSQFEQPDGSSTRDRAEISESRSGELSMTRVEVGGTYVAPVRPGSTERRNEPGWRMIAAVVEGPSGPWFLRFLGPEAEVAAGEESFDRFLRSLRLE